MTETVSEMAAPAADGVLRRPSLVGRTRAGLGDALAEIGVPEKERRMRVGQLWNWIYHYGVREFDAMTTIGKGLRAQLAERFSLDLPEVTAEQVSTDGTRKWLLRMPSTGPHDRGAEIECVYIPEVDRGTLCVSSQVGCTLTCTFCHTGTQRLVRNLKTEEIVAQLMVARERLGDFPNRKAPDGAFVPNDGGRFVSNIVFMGMGEPLANYARVMQAVRVMVDKKHGLGMSARGITVSTVGLVPAIRKLADEDIPVTFALSLHAPDDELRDELIPVNSRWKVDEALDAARGYFDRTGRRVSVEYALIKDMNDHAWRADLLADKLTARGRGWVHVNPIPLNPTPGSIWTASEVHVQNEFVRRLNDAGIPTTLRDTRGKEIDGACGQLVATEEDRAVAASVPVD